MTGRAAAVLRAHDPDHYALHKALRAAITTGSMHWQRACDELLALYRAPGADPASRIEACVTSPDWVLR